MILRAARALFFVLALTALAFSQSITGTWEHLSDSDGTKPGKGKALSITFDANGTCHLKATDASGKNDAVNGDGTYSVRNGRLTISLPVLELKVAAKPLSVTGDRMTLPFKLFNEGVGTSEWQRQGTASSSATSATNTQSSALHASNSTRNAASGNGTMPQPSPDPAPAPAPANAAANRAAGGRPNPLTRPAPHPSSTGGMKDELLCTCDDKTYDTPPEVLRACTRPKLTAPLCGPVVASQKQPCAVLKDKDFKPLYDNAVLGRRIGVAGMPIPVMSSDTPGNPKIMLIGNVIRIFFKPWRADDFFMAMKEGGAESDGEFAKLDPPTSNRFYLRVSEGALLNSPGGLVSIIGHELIHAEQLQRNLPVPKKLDPVRGFNGLTAAVNELEAWSWQTRTPMNFHWKIGQNETWKCETRKEQERDVATQKCREWQVRELIVRANNTNNTRLKESFRAWIQANSWAQSNWLPYNAGWEYLTTNDLPSQILYDPRASSGDGIDCHDGLKD